MEDLFRDFISRAEAPGGEEWLRSVLSQPSQPLLRSAVQAGSADPDLQRAVSRIEERPPPAPVDDDDEPEDLQRRRPRRHRRQCSPPPPAQKRRRNQATQQISAAVQPAVLERPSVTTMQLEPTPSSSAAMGEITATNVANSQCVSNNGNVALFSSLLSQMLQLVSTVPGSNTAAPTANMPVSNVLSSGVCNSPAVVITDSQASNVMSNFNLPVNTAVSGMNAAAVWADNGVTATSSIPSIVDAPSTSKGSGISEVCFKEAITCEVSPLGFHLAMSLKEKIWKCEYIDLLSLLPIKEPVKSDKKTDNVDKDEDRKRLAPKSFYNWVQAFCIYASVLGEKQSHHCSGLFRHLDIVMEAYRNFGGNAWYYYDESYRQKLAIYPGMKWGCKDVGLWLNLMLPQRTNPSRVYNQGNFRNKGYCYAYNDSQCRWSTNCRYRHECSHCAGSHPVTKCFKKQQSGQSNSKEVPKGSDASEVNKTPALARNLPRQSES